MGPHVGKVVDPDPEPTGHRSKRIAHGTLVSAKGPGAASPLAGENHVHRSSHADGPLELATTAPDGSAMLGSHELGVHVAREQRPLLHELNVVHAIAWGNVFANYLSNRMV